MDKRASSVKSQIMSCPKYARERGRKANPISKAVLVSLARKGSKGGRDAMEAALRPAPGARARPPTGDDDDDRCATYA